MSEKERLTQHLDSLFTIEIDEKFIAKHEDITRDAVIHLNNCQTLKFKVQKQNL